MSQLQTTKYSVVLNVLLHSIGVWNLCSQEQFVW